MFVEPDKSASSSKESASTRICCGTVVIFSRISTQKLLKKMSCQDMRLFSCRIKLVKEVGTNCFVVSPYFKQAGESHRDCTTVWGKCSHKKMQPRWERSLPIWNYQKAKRTTLKCFSHPKKAAHLNSAHMQLRRSVLSTRDCCAVVLWVLVCVQVGRKVPRLSDGWVFFFCTGNQPPGDHPSHWAAAFLWQRDFYAKLDQAMAQFFQMVENGDTGRKG